MAVRSARQAVQSWSLVQRAAVYSLSHRWPHRSGYRTLLLPGNKWHRQTFKNVSRSVWYTSSSVKFHFCNCSHAVWSKPLDAGKAINYTLRQTHWYSSLYPPWIFLSIYFSWKIAPALAAEIVLSANLPRTQSTTAMMLRQDLYRSWFAFGVLNIILGVGPQQKSSYHRSRGHFMHFIHEVAQKPAAHIATQAALDSKNSVWVVVKIHYIILKIATSELTLRNFNLVWLIRAKSAFVIVSLIRNLGRNKFPDQPGEQDLKHFGWRSFDCQIQKFQWSSSFI